MKKAIVIALLPVFLYSIVGWQWMFVLRLYCHQVEEWISEVPGEELEIITVPKNGHENHQSYFVNDNEIFHHGKYYDIKFKKRRGDEIVLYCHHDNDEETLLSALDQQLKNYCGKSFNAKTKFFKIIKLSVFEKEVYESMQDHGGILKIAFSSSTLRTTSPGINSVFVPPDLHS